MTVVGLSLLVALVGCRANKPSIITARTAFSAGDFSTAKTVLEELAAGPKQTRQVSELDLALVELAQGNGSEAEARLRKLRDFFDQQPTHPLTNDVVSLAADDTLRRFEISGNEQVLLRTVLAICSLTTDKVDAEAYCLQAIRRQKELSDQAGEVRVALAPYLHGTLREANGQDYDDAERLFRLVCDIRPGFLPAAVDIQRASQGAHSQPGNGVVYVIALVGRGPQLVEAEAAVTTSAAQIASTILRSMHKKADDRSDELVLPNIASVKVPVVEIPPSPIAAIGVSISAATGMDAVKSLAVLDQSLGTPRPSISAGATQTLTDVGELAIERSKREMPRAIARAVVRRAIKEASVTATAESLGLNGDAAAVFEFAAMNAWSATERADTRCWGLLPREIQVMRLELPKGIQRLSLTPLSSQGRPLEGPTPYTLRVEDGRSHYCVVFAPESIVSVVPNSTHAR